MGDDQHDDPRSEQEGTQERSGRDDRSTGGDAPAAASVEEREAVARGDDDLFEGGAGDDGEEPGVEPGDDAGAAR